MPLYARRPELLSLLRYDTGLLYNPSRIYHPRNVRGMPSLLICDQRLPLECFS
jgi:hypothetical protein